MILVQEALQEKKIAQIAEQIIKERGSRIVLIAGPSSSGKNYILPQTLCTAESPWHAAAPNSGRRLFCGS